MEDRRRGVTIPNHCVSRPGPSVRRLRRWPSLTSAALGLAVLLSSSCFGRSLLPKLPPDTNAAPVAVAVRVNTKPNVLSEVRLTELEQTARSLRGVLHQRQGLVAVDQPDSGDVIVELRGYVDGHGRVGPRLWGVVYATRGPRVPLGSPNAVESRERRGGPITPDGAVKRFAADVESIVADNFEVIESVRSRPVSDTGPIERTATAPLQGEYDLAVTPSPSCPASPVGAIRSDYHVSLYQRVNTLSWLVRGLCHDSFSCPDKMKGQVAGDEITLRSTYNPDILFFPTGPTADGWVWEGKGSGRVSEDRIDATVVGKV